MRAIDFKYIKLAEKIASNSSCKYKHGSVLTKNKEILSVGVNRLMSFNGTLTRFGILYSMHAELDAIRKHYEIPSNSTIYVARAKFKLSKPCSTCFAAIRTANIKRIVYSNEGNIEEIKL